MRSRVIPALWVPVISVVGALGVARWPIPTLGTLMVASLAFLPTVVAASAALAFIWFRSLVPVGVAALLADMALVALVLKIALRLATRGEGRVRLARSIPWLVTFVAWAWLSLVATSTWGSAPSFARVSLYSACFALLTLARDPGETVFRFVLLTAVAQLLLTAVLGHDVSWFVGDLHQVGILFLAGLAAVSLVRASRLRYLAGILMAVGIALTTRRGIWIAGLVELAILFAAGRAGAGRRAAVVLMAVVVAGVGVAGVLAAQERLVRDLTLNANSAAIRGRSMDYGLSLAAEHPLTGVGWANATSEVGRLAPIPSTVPGARGEVPPYGLWVNLAATTGFVGAVLFAGFVVALGLSLLHRLERSPLGRAGFVLLSGFVVLSMSETTLYAAAPGTLTFFVLMGMAASGSPDSHSEDRVEIRPGTVRT